MSGADEDFELPSLDDDLDALGGEEGSTQTKSTTATVKAEVTTKPTTSDSTSHKKNESIGGTTSSSTTTAPSSSNASSPSITTSLTASSSLPVAASSDHEATPKKMSTEPTPSSSTVPKPSPPSGQAPSTLTPLKSTNAPLTALAPMKAPSGLAPLTPLKPLTSATTSGSTATAPASLTTPRKVLPPPPTPPTTIKSTPTSTASATSETEKRDEEIEKASTAPAASSAPAATTVPHPPTTVHAPATITPRTTAPATATKPVAAPVTATSTTPRTIPPPSKIAHPTEEKEGGSTTVTPAKSTTLSSKESFSKPIPIAPFVIPDATLCGSCQSSLATVMCIDCGNLKLCEMDCDKETHMLVSKSKHKRVKWPLEDKKDEPKLSSRRTSSVSTAPTTSSASHKPPSTSAPASTSSSSSHTLCDHCSSSLATIWCKDCDLKLCQSDCDNELHILVKKSQHIRVKWPESEKRSTLTKDSSLKPSVSILSASLSTKPAASSSTSGLCDHCSSTLATVYCRECDKKLCESDCDKEVHILVKKSGHVRVPYPTKATPAPAPKSELRSSASSKKLPPPSFGDSSSSVSIGPKPITSSSSSSSSSSTPAKTDLPSLNDRGLGKRSSGQLPSASGAATTSSDHPSPSSSRRGSKIGLDRPASARKVNRSREVSPERPHAHRPELDAQVARRSTLEHVPSNHRLPVSTTTTPNSHPPPSSLVARPLSSSRQRSLVAEVRHQTNRHVLPPPVSPAHPSWEAELEHELGPDATVKIRHHEYEQAELHEEFTPRRRAMMEEAKQQPGAGGRFPSIVRTPVEPSPSGFTVGRPLSHAHLSVKTTDSPQSRSTNGLHPHPLNGLPSPMQSPPTASLRPPSPDSDNETSFSPVPSKHGAGGRPPTHGHPTPTSHLQLMTPSSTSSTQPLRLHPSKTLNISPPWVEPQPGESVITVWTGTWNLHAKPFPDNLSEWLPKDSFDLYVAGTEECENSIEASIVFSSKAKWVTCISQLLGDGYVEIGQHTLQAIHIIAFIRAPLFPYVHKIETAAVATGIGNIMGNKGGVGVGFNISSTSFLFINSHFAAHQLKVEQRNADFHAINRKMPLRTRILDKLGRPAHLLHVTDRFDRVFWLGDLNYRVAGNRRMVDALIAKGMIEVMISNDQLNVARERGEVFKGFIEGDITFMPTYKFDHMTDRYDTSKKRRIPSYTDRILWKPSSNIELLEYTSVDSVKSSDHRPVYATFKVKVKQRDAADDRKLQKFEHGHGPGSRACVIQ